MSEKPRKWRGFDERVFRDSRASHHLTFERTLGESLAQLTHQAALAEDLFPGFPGD